MAVGATFAALLCDPSLGPVGLAFFGFPVAFSAWLAWLFVSRRWSSGVQRAGTVMVLALVWVSQILVRVDGIDGENQATISLRWRPTAEDQYVAERASVAPLVVEEAPPLAPRAGDWLDFRGLLRRGEVHGVQIATDWNSSPPKELWRRKIGPAWSSMLVIDGRLFTQEQRGNDEALTCLGADTGDELWSHTDAVRFSDGQAGAGPRATPLFAAGKLYSFGATGILNCLDAASGKLLWSRDIVADTKAPLPMWGFSSSPLAAGRVVVVYGGAQPDDGLLAYDSASGEPAWTAATGPTSYSSAQLATFEGEQQLLFFSDAGLVAVSIDSGKLLWQFAAPQHGIWRVVQPRQLDDGAILIGCEDLGLVRLNVAKQDDQWIVTTRWTTRAIRPAYNDFVVCDDSLYGFDESILCCVDTVTGKRRWKAGRYGHGQVLLVADQKLLLIVSETGDVVLVSANPDKHEELGKFHAVTGKTWNHPVIAHGRLYVRNDRELACFALEPVATVETGL
jgi:outer membrane protein assembly factor BamB